MSEVTRIMSQIEAGNAEAVEQLLPLVYEELRKLAAAKMSHENPGQTLQATALVHDAYLRLVGEATPQKWETRDLDRRFQRSGIVECCRPATDCARCFRQHQLCELLARSVEKKIPVVVVNAGDW